MATRKALTVNQQIDALLKRQANPARKTPAKKSARSVVLVAAKNPRKTLTKKDRGPGFNVLIAMEPGHKLIAWFPHKIVADEYCALLEKSRPTRSFSVRAAVEAPK